MSLRVLRGQSFKRPTPHSLRSESCLRFQPALLLSLLPALPWLAARPPVCSAAPAEQHPYRLPSTNIKQRVLWGSTCAGPDGVSLWFGGEDQESEDGVAHTRLVRDGKTVELRDELQKANPLQPLRDKVWALREAQKRVLAGARFLYLDGLPADESRQRIAAEVLPGQEEVAAGVHVAASDLTSRAKTSNALTEVARRLGAIEAEAADNARAMKSGITPATLAAMRGVQVALEEVADALGSEPPPRALSPIAYEPKSGLFVLFGGDHFDYLTNDTWVFDPKARRWSLRHSATAPPPRANHAWRAAGDGTLVLTGGYTYFPNTDYMGGQYVDLNDGEWTYDVAADRWSGGQGDKPAGEKLAPPNSRVYRTGPFLPEFFFDGPAPDAAAFQEKLKSLPADVWTKTNPPHLPQVNRDWGSAVLDPDHDLLLRWSGGHCAHGGTDVIEYHLASNRWELCYPVEFPLGQLYTNTEYPKGWNFNRRPWVSGHTYQTYGVDPNLKKMLFLGHPPFGYAYDATVGDWTGRVPLAKAMDYSGAFFTLTTTPTPQGLVCWTEAGRVFRFDAGAKSGEGPQRGEWRELHVKGEKLPGAVVDNSTVAYDARRDRLLFVRKPYGDSPRFDGEVYALDLKSLECSRLSPANKSAAGAIPYLCQLRYDPAHDLLLAGATLPPGADGVRRTPAYDCAANTWVSFRITGDDPSGNKGRNVSLGLVFDPRRGLFWAVDAASRTFVLRFDPASADRADLGDAKADDAK